MMRAGRIALVAVVASVLAVPAFAAGGGEDGVAKDLLYRVINLLILIGVLVYFARKPIQGFFSDRRNQIRDSLNNASELCRRAESRYSKWQRKLADLEEELSSIRETARERAEREREQILADARAAAERIRNDARSAVDQELRRAKAQLRDEASELAVELAAGILQEQVTTQDRERLFDEFIERIERTESVRDRR
jgi:F-type H+-transporting ATPase subunit b